MSTCLAIFPINQSSWSYVHQLRYYKSAINLIKSHFSYGFPMVFPFSCGFPMVFPWFSHFPTVFRVFPVVFLWFSHVPGRTSTSSSRSVGPCYVSSPRSAGAWLGSVFQRPWRGRYRFIYNIYIYIYLMPPTYTVLMLSRHDPQILGPT